MDAKAKDGLHITGPRSTWLILRFANCLHLQTLWKRSAKWRYGEAHQPQPSYPRNHCEYLINKKWHLAKIYQKSIVLVDIRF